MGLHSLFMQLQFASPSLNPRLNPDASPDRWQLYLLSVSRAYRAELAACLQMAAEQVGKGKDKEMKQIQQELDDKNVR